MLALLDALFWQITLWTICGCVVVNVFIRIQAYFADPGREEFLNEWFDAFESHQLSRYKAGGLDWRVKDLSNLWSGGASDNGAHGE